MIDWNKFLGRCGIALLFVSLCAIGFEFHFWVGMIVHILKHEKRKFNSRLIIGNKR